MTKLFFSYAFSSFVETAIINIANCINVCSVKMSKNNVFHLPKCLYTGIIHAAFFIQIRRILLQFLFFSKSCRIFLNFLAACRIFLRPLVIPQESIYLICDESSQSLIAEEQASGGEGGLNT